MADADHVRPGRIAGKLAAARAMPVPPKAFGAEAHGFKLGPPLPEGAVAEFEERHQAALPAGYRLFEARPLRAARKRTSARRHPVLPRVTSKTTARGKRTG